jgi:glycosyltransferase involved in cell wall biosynthesis
VLYVHQHFSTPTGAAGTRSYENSLKLLERGHEVTVVCGSYHTGATGLSGEFRRGMRRGNVDGIDVIELELAYANRQGLIKRSIVFLRFAVLSIRIALSEKYDVVFATSTPLTAAIPGIAARWFRRKPFVFEVRDLWPELPVAMGVIRNPVVKLLLAWLEKAAYRAADRCIGLSPGIVDGIRRVAPAGRPVSLIPNGCDLKFRAHRAESAERLPGTDENTLSAVFTGAHGLANGLDALLDAAEVLKERQRDDIRIFLIGDGKLKEGLRDRAARSGLDNVTFMDPVPKTRLMALLADAQVGLMILANVKAFYFGTSPNKFFDYIALGLPVVNNYPGWLAGMIEDQAIGIAVPPENPQMLADALIELADNPDQREEMGVRARQFAEQNFDRSVLSGLVVDELEKAAEEKAKS